MDAEFIAFRAGYMFMRLNDSSVNAARNVYNNLCGHFGQRETISSQHFSQNCLPHVSIELTVSGLGSGLFQSSLTALQGGRDL